MHLRREVARPGHLPACISDLCRGLLGSREEEGRKVLGLHPEEKWAGTEDSPQPPSRGGLLSPKSKQSLVLMFPLDDRGLEGPSTSSGRGAPPVQLCFSEQTCLHTWTGSSVSPRMQAASSSATVLLLSHSLLYSFILSDEGSVTG